MEKRYLGDSVYVEVREGMLKLTTENGYGPTNVIYLEAEIMCNLQRYYVDALEFFEKRRKETSEQKS
jgi:hypothetical protein